MLKFIFIFIVPISGGKVFNAPLPLEHVFFSVRICQMFDHISYKHFVVYGNCQEGQGIESADYRYTKDPMKSLILCLILVVAGVSGQVVEKCRTDTYPPPEDTKLAHVIVNLDLDPAERWKEALEPVKDDVVALIRTITDHFNKYVLIAADLALDILLNTLPEPYQKEIEGVSKVLGIPEGEVALYNVFYELFTLCTSIIEEDKSGQLYHARNLDFGLFLGWDNKNDTWLMSEQLRKIVRNVDFQRNGKTVYQSASFLGYIGLMTAVRPGDFALTINERFNREGGFIGIYKWIMGDRDGAWMGFLVRDIMENSPDYESAKKTLMSHKLLAPAYYILSGNSTGQGVIITRSLDKTLDVQELNVTAGRWYLLQTNYDPWEQPPFYDDRRKPGNICMKEWGQDNVGYKSLFNVLSTKPNLNKLTVYSSILTVREGVTTWLQDCKTPCTPW
eukprot:sb/3464676/